MTGPPSPYFSPAVLTTTEPLPRVRRERLEPELAEWMAAWCVVGPDLTVSRGEAEASFLFWCRGRGEHLPFRVATARWLRAQGFTRITLTYPTRVAWKGFRLRLLSDPPVSGDA